MKDDTTTFMIQGCRPAQVPRLAQALQEAGISFEPTDNQVMEPGTVTREEDTAFLGEQAAGLNELLQAMSSGHRLRTDAENVSAAARQALHRYLASQVEWEARHPALPMRHDAAALEELLDDHPELNGRPTRRGRTLRWVFTTENEAHIHLIEQALAHLGAGFNHLQDQLGLGDDVYGCTPAHRSDRLMAELRRKLADMPDMRHYPLRDYQELNFQERQNLLDTAADTMAWIEDESLSQPPEAMVRRLAATAARTPTDRQAQLLFEAAPRMDTERAREAEHQARMLNQAVYSWQSIGHANWLQRGFHPADTLQLVLMPPGLPDHMDLADDPRDD